MQQSWSFKVVPAPLYLPLRDRETNWDGGIPRVALRACSSLLCNCLFPPVNPNSVSGWRVRLLVRVDTTRYSYEISPLLYTASVEIRGSIAWKRGDSNVRNTSQRMEEYFLFKLEISCYRLLLLRNCANLFGLVD